MEAAALSMGERATWLHMEEPTMAAEDFSFIAGGIVGLLYILHNSDKLCFANVGPVS